VFELLLKVSMLRLLFVLMMVCVLVFGWCRM